MSNTQNQTILEELMERHEDFFGTRPVEGLRGLADIQQIYLLEEAIATGWPLEYADDKDKIGERCSTCGWQKGNRFQDCCDGKNVWFDGRFQDDE